jgi:ATP-binding cassette subfamily B multidrug efflux pump
MCWAACYLRERGIALDMRRILRYLKPYSRDSILALLFMLGLSLADLAVPRLVQQIIDQGITRMDIAVIRNTSLLMIGAAMASALFAIGNNTLSVRAANCFAADLRSAVFHKIQTLSFGNLDQLQTGQLIVRLTSDVNQVQQIVLMSLRILARAPLMLLGSFVLLILTSRQLALLMLVLLPATMGTIWVFVRKGRPMFMEVQRKLDRLNSVLQENLAGVRVVKAFLRAQHENQRFDQASKDLMDQVIKVFQLLAVLIPTLFLFINLGTLAVVWFGGRQVINDTLTTGQVVAFVNYLLSTMFPLLMLGMIVGLMSAAQASAQRITEVLDSIPEVQNVPGARALSEVKGRVAFENVCFSYNHDCREAVLSGVNLVAEPGERVAILGATGSGKSSLIHLIPRFYDVTEGRVTIDGTDVRDVTLQSLRSQMAIALQEAVLFSGTIRDNIRYARKEASDEEIIAAAKAAQAHDFIMAFPDGYDALIGQRGVNLSGGQKQRIAIARALLTQPSILILDDSTSVVDVETEAKIELALEEWMAGRTSFVIAQRVSTVLNADKIVVLDRGQIAAVGTHAELMDSSPIYREIYDSQLGDGGAGND